MCRCRSSRWHPRNGARPAGPHARDARRTALLGERDVWQHWFNSAGLRIPVNPVATFNDAGMMLQAAEQGLGIALGRELLAADALCAGRLVQLSTVRVQYEQAQTYHLVYRPSLRDWPPLVALKQWLRDELELSRKSLVTYQPEDCAEGENQNRRSGKRRSAPIKTTPSARLSLARGLYGARRGHVPAPEKPEERRPGDDKT